MREFTCSCKWRYIITKKWVYGPIWDDGKDSSCAQIMSREIFKEGYGDCARNLAKETVAV